jgi:UDP-GlcNAc3NAcA epimerase
MKILTIVGARPQFIKAAALSRILKEEAKEIIVHTGQHFDANMSGVFFDEMSIPRPKYNLDIHGLSHGAMTGKMLEGIEVILQSERPDWVLIYGDTNSTLAGALAAAKMHIKVAHVEAGLRSFNMRMPEEINRIVADRISNLLLCPTVTAVENLKKEGAGINGQKVCLTGDVMLDAALFYSKAAKEQAKVRTTLSLKNFALATIHRAENTDNLQNLSEIIDGINQIHKELPVVLPLHPRTRSKLKDLNLKVDCHVVEPVGYFDMIDLLSHCSVVITDSGGLQKEAYFFEKPCITFRDETEWVELVEAGANKIVGANSSKIQAAAIDFLSTKLDFSKRLYGDGNASQKILESLQSF